VKKSVYGAPVANRFYPNVT